MAAVMISWNSSVRFVVYVPGVQGFTLTTTSISSGDGMATKRDLPGGLELSARTTTSDMPDRKDGQQKPVKEHAQQILS